MKYITSALRTVVSSAGEFNKILCRHPIIMRSLPIMAITLAGIVHGAANVAAHSGESGIFETFSGHLSQINYYNGPDGVRGTVDDVLRTSVDGLPVDFRAEDIGAVKLQSLFNEFNTGDYVKIDAYKHVAVQPDVLTSPVYVHHGGTITAANAPPPIPWHLIYPPILGLAAFTWWLHKLNKYMA